MENRACYGVSSGVRDSCLLPSSDDWETPTSTEIRAVLNMAGWTGEELARRVDVKGRTVRRWTSGESGIPYAVWCVLCCEANLGTIWK
ncbi:MAG: helix-turn-helix domain-containing protein [Cellvibrionaceae bacterium]